MGSKKSFTVPQKELEQFCKKYHIKSLSFFGSVLRKDFKPESDIDVLVEFHLGYKIGLLKMGRIENELSEMFGRKVDLRTAGDLSRYFRQDVLKSAEVQYAQG